MGSGLSNELNAIVDAYEVRQTQCGQADVLEFLPPRDHPHFEAIALELVRVDIEYGWQRARPRMLDDYRGMIPELFVKSRDRGLIAFEEYRQRRRVGQQVNPAEYANRFQIDVSDWIDGPVAVTGGESPGDAAASSVGFKASEFPFKPGMEWAGFELVGELGSGSSSRVFLARQPSLGNRHVVLKISREPTVEPDRLARLQHTNIMPIHSFHQKGEWHAICMPYFGSFVLSHWVEHLRQRSAPPTTNAELDTLCCVLGDSTWTSRVSESPVVDGASPPTQGTVLNSSYSEGFRRSLAVGDSYERTVLALTGRLAQALAHAHGRGVLHLDLKPANILITDDGEPMLLDFHLSTSEQTPEQGPLFVGGTLPYMSPEQLQTLTSSARVDARSDLYALGVVLYELLTGRLPFPSRSGTLNDVVAGMLNDRRNGPDMTALASPIRPATGAIIARCLAPQPERRYQSAVELFDDLDRQLRDLPLRTAGNPSWRERIAKFIRRSPRLTSGGTVLAAAFGILSLGAAAWMVREQRLLELEAREVFADFERRASESKVNLLLPDLTPRERERELRGVRQLLAVYGADASDEWRRTSNYRGLQENQRSQVEVDLGHLLFLLSDALARRGVDASNESRIEAVGGQFALTLASRAVDCFPPDEVPRALLKLRHRLLAIDLREGVAFVDDGAGEPSSTGSKTDQILAATECVVRGDFRGGLTLLRELGYSHPQDFCVQFLTGVCHESLHHFGEAVGCFDAAIALLPGSARAVYQRGRCRFQLRQFVEARRDFEMSLKLEPEFTDARVSRALTLESLGETAEGIDELTRAIDAGHPETRVYFDRSRMRRKLGDAAGADQDRQTGLALTPCDATSWVSRGVESLSTSPEQALQDFREAVRLNPREFQAQRNIAHVLAEHLQQPDEALRVLDRVLEQTADDPLAWAGRGVLRARQGKCEGARADAEQALSVRRESLVVYQAACIHALCGAFENDPPPDEQIRRVLSLVAESLQRDPVLAELALSDPDLESVQENPEFQQVVAAAQLLRTARDRGEIPSNDSDANARAQESRR